MWNGYLELRPSSVSGRGSQIEQSDPPSPRLRRNSWPKYGTSTLGAGRTSRDENSFQGWVQSEVMNEAEALSIAQAEKILSSWRLVDAKQSPAPPGRPIRGNARLDIGHRQ